MRRSVEMILEWFASGASRDDIVKSYPQLSAEDVEQAINFAAQSPQPLDPGEDDSLIDELLESNAEFRALAAKSKAGPRKQFGIKGITSHERSAH